MRPLAFADPMVRRLVVTSHPNHELAIFGFVQRARPHFLFLTDGGGEQRVEETRQALASLGLLVGARFLQWQESSLYQALRRRERSVFAELVGQVRAAIEDYAPAQILCESVEFYNPLHDLTLPIVLAAARDLPGVEIIEFPLIAQIPTPSERYRLQRFADDREHQATAMRLTAGELGIKLRARAAGYSSLREQLGAVVEPFADEHFATEFFAPARIEIPAPGSADVLRYERRGQRLLERGEVPSVITYRHHFLPVIGDLPLPA